MERTVIQLIFVFTAITLVNAQTCPPYQHALPYRTPTPINVNTKHSKVVNASSPLILGLGVFNTLLVRNTGKAIESMPNEIVDQSYVTGGILCKEFYVFYKTQFFINQNGSRSGNAVDGVGSPYEVLVIFYNIKYKTFKNALNYHDGLVITTLRITIGIVPNLLYIPVELILRLGLLRKPGSIIPVISSLLYVWFDVIPILTQYIVYPGAYVDLDTGKQYDAATYILFNPNYAFISHSQFEAFKNVLGLDGSPLQTTLPLTPTGQRKTFKVFGDVQQRLLPL